jgi:hypothetical protein
MAQEGRHQTAELEKQLQYSLDAFDLVVEAIQVHVSHALDCSTPGLLEKARDNASMFSRGRNVLPVDLDR